MSLLLSILLFLVVLFILILVHEWGHYITAKKTGMRVDEFGIGFPPRLWSLKKGETTYSINALPIGGYVKIFGEDPLELANNNDVDRARAFGSRPKWAQALVLIAGVTMNTIFAWLLFIIILVIGVTGVIEESAYNPDTSKLVVTKVLPDLPADGQIPAEAIITKVAVDDEELTTLTPTKFSEFIVENGAKPISIFYELNSEPEVSVTVTPKRGVLAEFPDQPAIGVGLALIDEVNYSFGGAIVEATNQTWSSLKAITVGLFSLIGGIFGGHADLTQVTGPVGIVGYVGQAVDNGLTSLLYFMAIISLNLAVINLLPVPALDGGRLVFVAIETITGRSIPAIWAARVNLAGFALLMLLMLLVTINDVVRLW